MDLERAAGVQSTGLSDVLRLLPHRYPMLLIDRVLEIDPGRRAVCLKNLSAGDWFFRGHYPEHPVMPGMLVLEALAQASGVVIVSAFTGPEVLNAYFSSIDRVRFRKPAFPGDQLRLEVELLQRRASVFKFRGSSYIGDALATEAELVVTVRPATDSR